MKECRPDAEQSAVLSAGNRCVVLEIVVFALLGLAACGGTSAPTQRPVEILAGVDVPEEVVCSFEGSFRGTLRFGDVDEKVEAQTAEARLFSSRLEVHASGAGWHLYGHSNLSADHVLRLQEAMWFGEGVAADRGQYVAVQAGETGRVFVRPHPAALEGVVLRDPVGRWLGCEAVGIAWALNDPGLDALELPRALETTDIELPFSLSYLASDDPFVEVRRHSYETGVSSPGAFAQVRERDGGQVRVSVSRYGAEEVAAILVGWVDESRLGTHFSVNGLHFMGSDFPVDHEVCEAPSTLPLFVEGPGGRVEAGRVDAGARLIVDEREESWAVVRPLGNELRLTRDRRFFVPSATLECTAVPGTHVRQLHRVHVNANGLACGRQCECSLRLATPHEAAGRCQARLWCGDELVFGDWSMGEFDCQLQDGRVIGADTEPSDGRMGDPRFSVDGDTITASDEAVGRLGAFHLEGRIVR